MNAAAPIITANEPQPLAVLLSLIQKAASASTAEELRFIVVNQTRSLCPYQIALLWSDAGVEAVSGVASVEHDSPFCLWIDAFLRRHAAAQNPTVLLASALPPAERKQWAEWLPEHGAILPLFAPGGKSIGLFLLARETPWRNEDVFLLNDLARGYAPALAWYEKPSWRAVLRARWEKLSLVNKRKALIAAAVALLFPVHLSVLGSGEIVARDPAVVRAPIGGIVERVLVKPNQSVSEGDALFELDTTIVKGNLDVAKQELETARAEYEQAAQLAFNDPEAKAQLGILSSRIDERQAAVAHLGELMKRSVVRSPRGGIAVIDTPSEWVGRPVAIGEKVLSIADAHDTEIEAWLAPADAIKLDPGDKVTLFLNAAPLSPAHGTLRYMTYESYPRPDGTIAHRVRADISGDGEKPLLGLKGTARIDGGRVPLVYWMLRRPLAVLRQYIGG